MSEFLSILFTQLWWEYPEKSPELFDLIYHWFNLLEAIAWVVFGLLVFIRYHKNRKSLLEVLYGIAFFFFAFTDWVEAWQQSSALIWFKLINLILLYWLRRSVMKTYYPTWKIY